MNQVSIIGNITKDIEIRETKTGKKISSITIAFNDGYGENQKAYYFDVDVWNKQAENLKEFCKKGSKIGVEGKLIQQTWQNDKGENRSKVLINASNITFLDKKEGQAAVEEVKPSDFENKEENDPFADFGSTVSIDDNFLD